MRHVYLVSLFDISQDRPTQVHTTHKVDCLVFLSTFRPCYGFTLLLCAMIASFAAISDRVILAELEGTLVLSFPDLFGFRGFLVISFLSGGLGATEALILSSLSPRPCFLCCFCVVSFVWPFHTALANARP